MIDSIIDSLKGEVVEGLTNKLGLSGTEVDKTLSSTKDAFDKTLSDEYALKGEPPSPLNPPSGCRFHTRCPIAKLSCEVQPPELTAWKGSHQVRCPVTIDK